MLLQTLTETQTNERYLRIKALEHLIEADFDNDKACHEVCHLIAQLFSHSDDDISRMVANLATKALQSSVETATIN